jgi:hypothetical protein
VVEIRQAAQKVDIMKIQTVVKVALLITAFHCLHASSVTVRQYQKEKSDTDSSFAVFNQIYIRGLGEGMENANRLMFFHVQGELHLPAKQLNATRLFCPPPMLVLQDENYISILETEIKHRLDQAAQDAEKVKRVMETPIDVVLMDGLRKTFPCTPEKIQEWAEALTRAIEQQSTKSKK